MATTRKPSSASILDASSAVPASPSTTGTIGLAGAANVAERSGQSGFNVMGAGHALANCTARDGLKDGNEVGLPGVDLDIRFRDGSIAYATFTNKNVGTAKTVTVAKTAANSTESSLLMGFPLGEVKSF
jgi:hypothetical protein